MTKDINHVIQEIAKQDKQLHNIQSIDTSLSKDMSVLKKDISDLKKYVKSSQNNFTLKKIPVYLSIAFF